MPAGRAGRSHALTRVRPPRAYATRLTIAICPECSAGVNTIVGCRLQHPQSYQAMPGELTRQGSTAVRPTNDLPDHNPRAAVSAATRVRLRAVPSAQCGIQWSDLRAHAVAPTDAGPPRHAIHAPPVRSVSWRQSVRGPGTTMLAPTPRIGVYRAPRAVEGRPCGGCAHRSRQHHHASYTGARCRGLTKQGSAARRPHVPLFYTPTAGRRGCSNPC